MTLLHWPSSAPKLSSRAVLWVTLLSLLFPPQIFADSVPPATPDPAQEIEIDPNAIDLAQLKAAKTFIDEQDRVLHEVFQLAIGLEDKTKQKKAELGEVEYNQRALNGLKDELMYELPGLGKAEPTSVDGTIIARVVHEQTGIAFLLLPPEIKDDSKHLDKLIARQHFEAGGKGRNVMIIRMGQGEPQADRYLTKPSFSTRAWWKEWVAATLEKPTKGDVLLGTVCAVLQGSIVCGLSALKTVMEPSATFDPYPAVFTAAFGMTVGTFIGSWNNIANRGEKWQRVVKNALVLSIPFNYGLQIGRGGLGSLSLYDPSGWLMNAYQLINILVNTYGKDFWTEFYRIRVGKGLARKGTVRLKIPFTDKTWDTEIKNTRFESQMINLGSTTLKMGDLLQMGFTIPGVGPVGLGKVLFWLSPIYVQYAAVKYAEWINYEHAPKLRAKWEHFKRGGPLLSLYEVIRDFFRDVAGRTSAYCSSLLTPPKKDPPTD